MSVGNQNRHAARMQPRITNTIMVVVVIFFAVIYAGICVYLSDANTKQTISNQQGQIDKTEAQVSFWQTTTMNIAKKIALDVHLEEEIRTPETLSAEYALLRRNIRNTLLTYAHIENGIQEITIYTDDGRTFSSAEMRGGFYPEQNQWYLDFIAQGEPTGYTDVHMSTSPQQDAIVPVISYVFPYYSPQNYKEKIGNIIISLEYASLEDILLVDMAELEGYCLYDGAGKRIVEAGELTLDYDKVMTGAEEGIYRKGSGNTVLIADDMQDGWHLRFELSNRVRKKQIGELSGYLLIITFFLLVTIGVILKVLIRNIVKPVEQLTEAAVELGNGNFDVVVDIHTKDEIEMLAEVFNHMVGDIQQLLEKSVESEKITRKMQIDNLMLQINPHFIYNTLNSIIYMASEEGNEKIIEFTNAFISLLQNTLRIRNTIYVSLRETLENIENYLILQKYRYVNKFEIEIICPEELKYCAIPNIMVQPIVENAIFHGIAPKEGMGHLKICVERIGDDICICVEDDGQGMSQEKADRLLDEVQTNSGGMRKIGIANVNNRMKEIYGEPYQLHITSQENVGTKIVIRIPYQEYRETV